MTAARHSRAGRYGVAIISVGCAMLLKLDFGPWLGEESPFLLLFAAVTIAAWYGGLGPAVLATLLATLGTDYFFLHPVHRFLDLDHSSSVRLLIFLIEALTLSAFSAALQRARERAEIEAAEQRRSRELFRNTFELAGVGIARVAPDGHFLQVNQRLCDILGYQNEELLLHSFQSITYPEDLPLDIDAQQRMLAGKAKRYAAEKRYFRKDGTVVWADLAVSLVREPGRPDYFITVIADITDRKQSEEKIRLLNESLEHRVEERTEELREANAELRAFTYSIAHDLRAPLTSMQGLAQALMDDYGEAMEPMAREYTKRIIRATARMDTMTQDLLGYSQLYRSELRLEPVSLESVVDEVLAGIAPNIAARRAQVRVERPLPAVIGHVATLQQIIANLISNGVKFVDSATCPVIVIRAENGGDAVRLWVEDNGIGIAPEYHERIFGVFERLHGVAEYPGSGIGLAIVRRGAERLGGTAGVISSPGQGSRFWIDFSIHS